MSWADQQGQRCLLFVVDDAVVVVEGAGSCETKPLQAGVFRSLTLVNALVLAAAAAAVVFVCCGIRRHPPTRVNVRDKVLVVSL